MDEHFRAVLSTGLEKRSRNGEIVRFIASDTFAGSKPGYYFTTGSKGVGYYYDPLQKDSIVSETAPKEPEVILKRYKPTNLVKIKTWLRFQMRIASAKGKMSHHLMMISQNQLKACCLKQRKPESCSLMLLRMRIQATLNVMMMMVLLCLCSG